MQTQQNVINDLGTLTKVPSKILTQLINKANLCIGSTLHDAINAGETTCQINIGIGLLSISITDMQVKFIPSKDLKTAIKKSLEEKIDPLELELEQTLITKLINICNEEL